MKSIIRIILLILCANQLSAQTTSVLFIGNSYTYVNNLPQTLADLALSKGDTLIFDSSAPGGYTFQLHTTNATTISKINQRAWDYVVLQEQSQMPSFPPSQVSSDTYPYAARLDSMIVANDSCTETVFYMTWGRQNGDSSNCAFYPPICTYNGMQQRLRESYLQMATDNHASAAPVGVAWKHVRDNYPSIGLYQSDQSHPTIYGTYLAACVFYASFFHKTPIGASFPSSISSVDALVLQTIGGATVLDSLALWQGQGDIPSASFSFTQSGNGVQFNNNSENAVTTTWSFGDTNNSSLTSPQHTYAGIGQYTVSLTSTNGCKTFKAYDTIQVTGMTGVNAISTSSSISIFPNPATSQLNVEIKGTSANKFELRLYNAIGQLVISKSFLNQQSIQMDIASVNSGLYNLILIADNSVIANQKLVINTSSR